MSKIIKYLLLFLIYTPLYAEIVAHSLETDPRAKITSFNPNQIYKINTHYLVSTDIIFGEDEIVNTDGVHLGDASAWDIQTNKNHLYVKAKKLDAAGNLSVLTNKYSYHFVLAASDSAIDSHEQTLFLKFIYPNHDRGERHLALQMAQVPHDICLDKAKYNLQYSYTGNAEQAPIKACDDGLFTYFRFRKQVELPAIFIVLANRKETVVNYRIENGYVVLERIAKAFTLRNGEVITSVYNDKYIGDWHKVK